ncbi:nuclear transport factor 2 family protein [soil metagenome]
MRATLLLTASAAALLLAGSVDLSARWADEAAVRQAVQYYFFDGGKHRDSVALRKASHPDARMLFARDGKLVVVPIGEYIARVAGNALKPGEVDPTRRRVTSVDVAGDAAMAIVELERPDAVVTDYMSLLKVDGRWLIVTKIFARETRQEHVGGR